MRRSWILAPLVLLLVGCCCPSPGKQPADSGRILAVKNDANVFVISIGEEDGVQTGSQYMVARDGR